jgi:hypothetical protein
MNQVRGVRPSTAPGLVYTDNQFGADQHPFFGPRDLCVNSTIPGLPRARGTNIFD